MVSDIRMSQQSWTESLKVKDLTEQIGQGFGILNTEGKFEHVNAQLAEMLGYNQEELSGISYHSLFKMDGTDFILNDTIHEKEITLITKTREDIAARLTVKSLNDNTDRLYILLTKIDYGDYRLSSDFLKALDLASPRRMVVGRDLKIQYVSTAFMEANPEQLIGFSALEGVREEYRDGLRNVVEAVFEEGVIGSIEISDSTDTEPTQWFVLRISPIRQGDSVIAVVITSIDITERIHTENALRESEEKFRGIFENANDGIILTNERGHINAVNSAYEKLYSVKRNEILDKPLWEVQASLMSGSEKSIDFQEQLENTISNFYETGDAPWLNKVTQGEFIHPESGSRIDLEQQAFKIPSSNGFMLCSFVWDITERNRIEDARKRSEQLYRALTLT